MAFPGKWDGWTRCHALEALIKNRIELDTSAVEQVLEPTIQDIIAGRMSNNQDRFLLTKILCIYAFTNDPSRAVSRIRLLASKHLYTHEMRDVIAALQQSCSKEATDYLIDLAQDPDLLKQLGYELLEALATSGFAEAEKAILSAVDPTIEQPRIGVPAGHSARTALSKAIADLSEKHTELEARVFQLCDEKLSDSQREVIADAIKLLSTPKGVLAGLNLISDKARIRVPYGVKEAIENSLLERVPVPGYGGAYELKPRQDMGVRRRLFDMAVDDHFRCGSAFDLLGFTDQLRLEYGKPSLEPRHPNWQRGMPWPLPELIGKDKGTGKPE